LMQPRGHAAQGQQLAMSALLDDHGEPRLAPGCELDTVQQRARVGRAARCSAARVPPARLPSTLEDSRHSDCPH
jgi:hypothetical protein